MRIMKITDRGPVEMGPGDELLASERFVLLEGAGDCPQAIAAVLRSLVEPQDPAVAVEAL
jgi:hypothetical protein